MTFLRRRWTTLWPFFVAVVVGVLACHRLHDADLFWHLDLGRSVLAEHTRVVTERIAIPELGTKCIAHEWLWDVFLAWFYGHFGWKGVGAFVVGVAVLAGFAVGLIVTRWDRNASPRFVPTLAITFLIIPLYVVRLSERPEAAALVFWPLGLLLAKRLSERGRIVDAILLALLGLVWTQIHLSVFPFALAAGIILLPSLRADRASQIGIAGLALSLLTTPPGWLFFDIPNRMNGYVVDHINEWKPLSWSLLDPFDSAIVPGPTFAVLAILGAIAAFTRKARLPEILLGAIAIFLVAKGRRSVAPGAILLVPLVRHGFDRVVVEWAAVVASFIAFERLVGIAEPFAAPLPDPGEFPTAAARLLEHAGEHRALTTYRSGPPVAFSTNGRVRGYIDSRVPLFSFSAFDLAAAQTVWRSPELLGTAIDRYHFDLAILERSFPVCQALATHPDWVVVHVEPQFTTFAKKDSPLATGRIEKVRPCGDTYLDDTTCDTDSDFAKLAPFSAPEFLSYLRAERALRCAKGRFDGDAILSMIPAHASGFEPANDALHAWLLALANRPAQAIALLAPHVKKGKVWVLADSLAPLSRGGADDDLREMIEPLAKEDDVDPSIVIALALACARQGDERCAHLEAARAVAAGRPEVIPAVCFLRTRSSSRNDAEAWLDALGRRSGTRIRCP